MDPPPRHRHRHRQWQRRLVADDESSNDDQKRKPEQQQPSSVGDDKSFKICSVLGGLDVTRYVSRDARSLFAEAIDDVELIREVISETATNGGVGHRMTLGELNNTLDRRGRGFEGNGEGPRTTLEAGLSYVDDRPNRRMDYWVGLMNLGSHPQKYCNSSTDIDVRAELAIVQAAALVFPWIVDRKSKPDKWWTSHLNGRSTGERRAPFRFDALYSAAWIGSWGEAWAYYPPMNKLAGGEPMTFADPGVGIPPNGSTHDLPFIKPNLPWNNPMREAMFSKPYADYAQPGDSIITCLAPLYYTGRIANQEYNDTYIASFGLDMEVQSLSSLLDVLTDRMTQGSFALLVDFDLDVIVISQEVVNKIYPARTGFEEERVTYDLSGQITGDRRNETYLVSDTIFQGLTGLENADWDGLRKSLEEASPGERDFTRLNITLAGEHEAVEFFVMYEKWRYTADWALLAFAPVEQVDNAIQVGFADSEPSQHSAHDTSSLTLEVKKGQSVSGMATLQNAGTLDVALTPGGIPSWMRLHQPISNGHVLRSGHTLDLVFDVSTDELDVGKTQHIFSFHVRDDSYPDCFYDEEKGLRITVNVLPLYSYFWAIVVLVVGLGMGLLVMYAYVERRGREADTVFEVKKSELIYDDPPEVLGRGTFGLVVSAEYRGTRVAVKRVIPPTNTRARGTSSSLLSATIFDYDSDSEDAEPQKEYGAFQSKSPTAEEVARADLIATILDVGEDSGSDEEKAEPQELVTAKPLRRLSQGMIPGSLSRPSSVRGILSGSLKSFGDETAPLSGRTKSTADRNMSGLNGSFKFEHASRSGSYAYLRDDFVHEMRILSALRHPNITTFMGAVIARGEEPLLVMECMNRGSLYDLLHNLTMVFEGEIILSILRDVAQGMRFLHSASPQIVHGDLKAANVLVDARFGAKVSDFGLSIKRKVGASGTPYWMAPELLRGAGNNTAASDVYSFGILVHEVYSRKDPYHGEDFDAVIRDICDPAINKRPPVPDSMPSEVSSLLYASCISADPASRPMFAELDGFLKRFASDNMNIVSSKIAMNTNLHDGAPLIGLAVLPAQTVLLVLPRRRRIALVPHHTKCGPSVKEQDAAGGPSSNHCPLRDHCPIAVPKKYMR